MMDCMKFDYISCWKGWVFKSWFFICKIKKKYDYEWILNKNKENSVVVKIK